jgi:hypothetical protein
MTTIRAACPTLTCEGATIVLTPERRPGMMTGPCTTCGRFWHMKTGVLYELVDGSAPPPAQSGPI